MASPQNPPNFSPRQISQMKAVAWRDKQERNCTQAQALNRVAQEHGYPDWRHLMQHHNSGIRRPVK
jgi:hypothetical protein